MKFWQQSLLGLLAIGALAGIYYADEHYTEKERKEKEAGSKALDFATQDVRKLRVVNESGSFAFERESGTADWKMTAPKAVRPDQDAVNNLVSALQSLTLESELSGTEKVAQGDAGQLALYGLDKPRVTVELDLDAGKGTKKLVVGNDLQVGSSSGEKFNALSVYALSPGRKNMLIVNASVVSATRKALADFRTKEAFAFKTGDVRGLEITKAAGEKIVLKKTDSDWKIVEPRDMLADNNNVGLYLDRLMRLKVDSTVEAEGLNPDVLSQAGLNPPSLLVTLRNAEGKEIQTAKLGLNKQNASVLMADGALGKLPLSMWADLSPELKTLRDRRVMRGVPMGEVSQIKLSNGAAFKREANNWYSVAAAGGTPAQPAAEATKAANADVALLFADWEFLTADEVIETGGTAATPDLGAHGLGKPLSRFSFEFKEEAKRAPEEILVGNRVAKDEKKVYVKRSGSPAIFSVEAGWLDKLAILEGKKPATSVPNAPVEPAGTDPHAQK